MTGEQVGGLPDALGEWVDARAGETGRSPEEVVARAVALARLLEEHDDALSEPESLDGAAALGDDAADRLADLDDRVAALDAELDEKIDDVRSRVIQVKREADAKADADHDHPDLRETAESAAAAAAEVDALRADVEDVEGTVETGFANYEEVLEYLTDAADDHDAKLSTVATVLADLRTRLSRVEAHDARRRAAAELQAEANRLGLASAACGACASKVRLGLLSTPECPHCGEPLASVEPASGFFGTATLAVGGRPALSGETAEETDPEDLFEDA
ncbi:CopG family transcriptional regulator [Halobaculum lipolyticum]|uniref:CopG family transcriptional regulator n=1 Tax=Halobaculum lipolyticum TaxID=3032001 RepID=A0ABD5W981_9EURY|nr:CopG family transcriptional regulator [Halobaculum sp. DT31]